MKDRSSLLVHPQRVTRSSISELRHLPSTTPLVLVSKSEDKVVRPFARVLQSYGLNPHVLADWAEAPAFLPSATLVIILLDRHDSLEYMRETCGKVRMHTESSIMIVLRDCREIDGRPHSSLDIGDVIIDPLLSENVVDHIQRLVHGKAPNSTPRQVLEHGDLQLEHEKYKVTVSGKFVALTPSEYKLLHTLMRAPGRVFLREELLNVLYDQDETVVDRVIDVHIGKVRRKIEKDPAHPEHILTVRGVGYKFSDSFVH